MSDAAGAGPRPWRAIALGLLSSVLFLWLAARGVSIAEARASLATMRWEWWIVYVLASAAVQGMRVWRWADQVRALGARRFERALSVGAVGQAAIFFLPARLGEFLRPVWIAAPGELSVAEATSTVVSERLIDGVLVGLLLLGTGLWVGQVGGLPEEAVAAIQRGGVLVGGAFMVLMAGVWFVALRDAQAQALLARLLGRWPALLSRISGMIERFHGGWLALMRGRAMGRFMVVSVILWLCNCLTTLLLFEGFGLSLPISSAFVVLGATAVGLLAPAGPASIGPLHLAVVWSLGLYGVADAVALNLATLLHLGHVVANGLIGLIGAAGLRAPRDA